MRHVAQLPTSQRIVRAVGAGDSQRFWLQSADLFRGFWNLLLDAGVLLLILFFAVWGAIRGAARQIAQMLAVLVATLLAQPSGARLGAMLVGAGLPSAVFDRRREVTAIFAFIVIYLALGAVLRFLVKRLFQQDDLHRRRIDRILGMLLGGVKFAAVAYVVLCMVVLARAALPVQIRWIDETTSASIAYRLASRQNLFQSDRELLGELGLKSDWTLAPKLGRSPLLEALKDNPKYKEILARPSMAKTVEKGDTREALRKLLQEVHQDHERDLLNAAAER